MMRSLADFFRERRILASVALAVALAPSAVSQTSQPAASKSTEYSTLDLTLFGGGQWFQLYQSTRVRQHKFAASGIWGIRFTQDFSRYIGIEESFYNGFNNLLVRPFRDPAIDWLGIGVRNYTFAITPVFHLAPRESKFRPFLAVGPGVTFFNPTNDTAKSPNGPAAKLDMKYGPSLVYGVGLKINASRRIGFRIDARDTFTRTPHFGLTDSPNPAVPGLLYITKGGTEHALSATIGVTFRFGLRSEAPPAPPAPPPPPPPPPKPELTISEIQGTRDVCPGDDLALTVNVTGVPQDQTATYQWLLNGQPVEGAAGSRLAVPTQGRSGPQKVQAVVTAAGVSAKSPEATFNIKENHPAVQVSAYQSMIALGDKTELKATVTGCECGGGTNVKYTASEGSVVGNTFDSTGVSFDMGNRSKPQTKVITITATGSCEKGGGTPATATTQVTVTLKPEARRLDDIVFPANNSRVNNCAKRLLLEVLTPLLRDDPNAKVVLIGHRDTNERGRNANDLDRQRVLNAAAVLSAGTGICPQLELSRVRVDWVGTNQSAPTRPTFCGASTAVKERSGQSVRTTDTRAQYRRVEVWFVPGGADMPAGVSPKDAPESDIKAKGCPR